MILSFKSLYTNENIILNIIHNFLPMLYYINRPKPYTVFFNWNYNKIDYNQEDRNGKYNLENSKQLYFYNSGCIVI